MRNINRGRIKDNKYVKYVNFGKAVLWKDRQISLPIEEMKKIRDNNIDRIIFIDRKRGEKWEFDRESVERKAKYKKEGQEPQYYWGIELAKVTKLDEEVQRQKISGN